MSINPMGGNPTHSTFGTPGNASAFADKLGFSATPGSHSPHSKSGASGGQPSPTSLGTLFDKTTGGQNAMSKDQFHSLFSSGNTPSSFQGQGPGLYASLDPNNTGQISRQSFVTGLGGK